MNNTVSVNNSINDPNSFVKYSPNMCRACLSDKNLQSIFLEVRNTPNFNSEQNQCLNEENTILEMFNCYKALEISQDDQYPKHICNDCLKQVVDAYKFWNKCKDSLAKLNLGLDLIDLKDDLLNYDFDGDSNASTVDSVQNNESYTCTVCGKSFASTQNLLAHQQIHDRTFSQDDSCSESDVPIMDIIKSTKAALQQREKPNISCSVCRKAFKTKTMLTKHMKVHESSTRDAENLDDSGSESDIPIMDIMKSIKASRQTNKSNLSCKKSFSKKTMFMQHINAHKLSTSGAEASKCLDMCIKCKFKFVSEDEFINHVCKAVSDVYECEICFKQYKSRFALKEHKEITHEDNSLFICSICKASFKLQKSLRRHELKIHKLKPTHTCTTCGEKFDNKILLRKHSQTHMEPASEPKCFLCQVCGLKLKCTSKIKAHLESHSDTRNYNCDKCPKTYKTYDGLQIHKATHNQTKQFACEKCGKVFSNNYLLQCHIKRLHINAKPFKCHVCSKSFNSNGELVIHVRIHTGERPFPCKECEMAFSSASRLTLHMLKHTGNDT